MPGPAIYIVAVIGTAAAALAFKEFVYDPHLRHKVDAWRENMQARRRERRNRGRQAVAVPLTTRSRSSSSSSGSGDDNSAKGRKASLFDSQYSTSPIELEKLVEREMDEWRSGAEVRGDDSGLRFRHGRGPSSIRTTSTPNLLDEPSSSLISTPTLEPTRGERDVTISSGSSTTQELQTPSPFNSSIAMDSGFVQPLITPSDNISSPVNPPAIRIPSPSTEVAPMSPSSRVSTPDSDLSSTMLTSNYLTPVAAPHSIAPSPMLSPNRALSPETHYDFLSSTSPRSGAMSPFSDVDTLSDRAGMTSPLGGVDVLLSPPSVASDVLSESDIQSTMGDEEMFSFPSESRAPSEIDDEQFEIGSDGSDGWTGIDDDRVPPH